jgi:hypothetical protein
MVVSIIMYSLLGSLANSLKMRSKTPLFSPLTKALMYDLPVTKTRGQITPCDAVDDVGSSA